MDWKEICSQLVGPSVGTAKVLGRAEEALGEVVLTLDAALDGSLDNQLQM